jgi:ribulose-5-phosphate 4-epimerase/fuculose-1-phosphate aldolase
MNAAVNAATSIDSFRPEHIPPEEWRARVDLAACYRLHAHYGWTDLIYTHISARVPGAQEHFLLNPFGLMFDEVTASNLVKIDLDGNVIASQGHAIHRAGFVIHSAIHAARPDAQCVIHSHTRAGMAVSCLPEGLLNLTQHASFFHGRVAYHDSEGVATDISERERLARDLGNKQVMILRNHGTLVAGQTVAQAFSMMWHLERAMQAQVDVLAMGRSHTILADRLAQKVSDMGYNTPGEVRANGTVNPMGFAEWPALLRLVDRLDPSFKT